MYLRLNRELISSPEMSEDEFFQAPEFVNAPSEDLHS